MHDLARKLFLTSVAVMTLAAPASSLLYAQDDGPPNVLIVRREYLKPGKGGMLHDRSESAFVSAFAEAKSNSHYFAFDSLSGPSRSLFTPGLVQRDQFTSPPGFSLLEGTPSAR